MKNKLTYRELGSGEYQIFWNGEDVSGKSWDSIMRIILRGREGTGITFVESRMVETFPGPAPENSKEELEANKGMDFPSGDEGDLEKWKENQ